MSVYVLPLLLVVAVWTAIVVLNERAGLLSCDRFPSAGAKYFAYLWLGAFLVLIAVLVTSAAQRPATSKELQSAPFWSIFMLHGILVAFLAGWWFASGRPGLREFLNIRHEKPLEVVAVGTAVGVGGWIVTIVFALAAALLLRAVGVIDAPPEPPAMIGWLAGLPVWKKALIVLSAMTVEEAFFRSFLQKRIGLAASTVLFALAHFTYAQPLMLIGVATVSVVIGITFYRTKNVLPGVIAHGVFDAVQLFVIVPLALRMVSAGA